jgi:hypothetical protein
MVYHITMVDKPNKPNPMPELPPDSPPKIEIKSLDPKKESGK